MTGAAPLSYRWYHDAVLIPTATSASLAINSAVAGDAGAYTVVVANAVSSANFTVNPLPTVTVNSQTICVGDSATLTATASAANPAYFWSPGGETTAPSRFRPLPPRFTP